MKKDTRIFDSIILNTLQYDWRLHQSSGYETGGQDRVVVGTHIDPSLHSPFHASCTASFEVE
jgi:hypothetical protein